MSRETILAAARRAAEASMSGQCRITRFTPMTLDTATLDLLDNDPSDDLIYEGAFRMKSPSSAVLALNTEGQLLTAQQLLLCIPIVAGAAVQVDDRVDIVDGGLEPGLTGRGYRIAGQYAQTWATEARLPVEGLS
jgi:hypothetical protein